MRLSMETRVNSPGVAQSSPERTRDRLADLKGPIPKGIGTLLGADLPMAERDRVFHPSGRPVRGLQVGLTLFENPEG
jgi:hypothetical protein